MTRLRPFSIWTSIGVSAWLAGCGSPPEPAKGPAPVKVEWSNAGGGEDSSADSDVKPGEVDLDAPAAKKPPARTTKKEPSLAKEPPKEEPPKEPAPPPEPVAESTPPPTEAETDLDLDEPAEPAETEPAAPTPLGKEIRAAVKSKEKPSTTKKAPPKKRAAAATVQPAAAYTGPNPCKTTHFSVPRVKEACESGGRTAAKGVMKDAVGKALAAGASLKCGDCHVNQTSYALKKDAVAQLKKWLGP